MRHSRPFAEALRTIGGRLRASARDDAGSAALEFLTAGVLLLVPLAYLVIALGELVHTTLPRAGVVIEVEVVDRGVEELLEAGQQRESGLR